MTEYKKKLIEVALPLDAINAASAREKGIRHGHPSTLHLWWARRPLAACRAVLFAQLVDDPSAHPEKFPTEEEQDAERQRLFRIIEQLVLWESTTDAQAIAAARREVHAAVGGAPPMVVDPFAGGGSIPVSAQWLGLEVEASDLNPVAVLINKAMLELPPRFAGQTPIGPSDSNRMETRQWPGASGLAEDVRRYARWMAEEARSRIGQHYPRVAVPSDRGGGQAVPIAWLWARTVTCPNPACGARMPLVNSYALSRRKNREAWLAPVIDVDARTVRFEVRHGKGCPPGGTVGRSGATCLVCETAVPLKEVRTRAKAGDLGAQLLCIVAEGNRERLYLKATAEQVAASQVVRPTDVPDSSLPAAALGFRVQGYGIDSHDKLFTDRQLVAMTTFSDLAHQVRGRVLADGGSEAYADAIATYMALAIGRLANRGSSQCFWNPGRDTVEQVFARNAMPMIWVYAESNPFSASSGNFLGQVEYLVNAIATLPAEGTARVLQRDARVLPTDRKVVVSCDPPYYDNVPYADLSDFFYVWFRRTLRDVHPELFTTLLVPKAEEMIAEPARQGSWEDAAAFFEEGLRTTFARIRGTQHPDHPFTVFYAFKQTEEKDDGAGEVSTGWETMLQGLIDADVAITGTWPVRTEQAGGLRQVGRAALASSIVLVCRPREATASIASRQSFIAALRDELPDALRQLQLGNVAPVDLAQAAIGPGMAVFSRFARVVEGDGTPMRVRSALSLINQVLDGVMAEQEADFDRDSRWAIAWADEFGLDEGSAGTAETLCSAKGTSIAGLVSAGILHQDGNRCWLRGPDELDQDWDPEADDRLTVWEVVHHLLRVLSDEGEAAAAALLAKVPGSAEAARELAYRMYTVSERRGRTEDALRYNGLVAAWPELMRQSQAEPAAAQGQLL
jgi:putative DNA methylase